MTYSLSFIRPCGSPPRFHSTSLSLAFKRKKEKKKITSEKPRLSSVAISQRFRALFSFVVGNRSFKNTRMCTKAAAVASYPHPEPEPFLPSSALSDGSFLFAWLTFQMHHHPSPRHGCLTVTRTDLLQSGICAHKTAFRGGCDNIFFIFYFFLSISISETGYIFFFFPAFWSYFANPYSSHPAQSVSAHPHETLLLPWMLYLGKQIFCLV